MAGPVAGDPNPFVVDETADPLVIGTLPLRVLPAPLAPGQGIAADGDQRTTEAAAVGTVADEPDFDRPGWAATRTRPGSTSAGPTQPEDAVERAAGARRAAGAPGPGRAGRCTC